MAKSFKALDLNRDGVISLPQLKQGLAKYLGVDQSKAVDLAKQIFKKVDLNNSGAIDFSCKIQAILEFIMCCSNIELTVN